MAITKLVGEIELDGRKARLEARAIQTEFNNLGRGAQRSGANVQDFVKRMVGARSATDFLAKSVRSLASSLVGGAIGGATIGALVNAIKGAREESNKLADALDKAVGTKAADNISGTTQRIAQLTSAIEESQEAIRNQGMLNAVAAFFFNEDADRAAKAFEKAVEARIAAGDKLIQQTAEQNAQNKILAGLEGNLAEAFKSNIQFRKELAEIDAREGLTDQQKDALRQLANEARIQRIIIALDKKASEEDKKSAEESKKTEEERARTVLKILDNFANEEEQIFQKNAEDFKRAQEEKKKAAEEFGRSLIESSRRAAATVAQQDQQGQSRLSAGLERSKEILGATRAGQGALDTARRRRQREVRDRNFRLAQAVAPTQKQRESLARQVAAGETPTIGERQIGFEEDRPANLVAAISERGRITAEETKRTGKQQTFGAGDIGQKILAVLEQLSQKLPAAVPQ